TSPCRSSSLLSCMLASPRLHTLFPYTTLFRSEILGVGDRLVRALDRLDQSGKDLLTVEQELHTIAGDDGGRGVRFERREERRFAEPQVGQQQVRGDPDAAAEQEQREQTSPLRLHQNALGTCVPDRARRAVVAGGLLHFQHT